MKLKAVGQICKKDKAIIMHDIPYSESFEGADQWIGNSAALYPVGGLPRMNVEQMMTLFEITEKQSETMYTAHYIGAPEGINLSDYDGTEEKLESNTISIQSGGWLLKPLRTQAGISFIKQRYLSPLMDELDHLELYERSTPEGAVYIAAKVGYELMPIILPHPVIDQQFVSVLSFLANECRATLELQERRKEINSLLRKAAQDEPEAEQTTITDEVEEGAKDNDPADDGTDEDSQD